MKNDMKKRQIIYLGVIVFMVLVFSAMWGIDQKSVYAVGCVVEILCGFLIGLDWGFESGKNRWENDLGGMAEEARRRANNYLTDKYPDDFEKFGGIKEGDPGVRSLENALRSVVEGDGDEIKGWDSLKGTGEATERLNDLTDEL